MKHTTEKVSTSCTSERIYNIQKRIHAIKSSEKLGVKYMQAWEEKIAEMLEEDIETIQKLIKEI